MLMLKSALVAMTILGCNCEQNTCEYIRTADLDLSGMADCQARMTTEIERTDAQYPLVVAVCEKQWQVPAATTAAATPLAGPQPAEPPAERTILVRARERYFAIMSTADDGLGTAVEFVTVPAGWLERQISARSPASTGRRLAGIGNSSTTSLLVDQRLDWH